MLVSTSLRVAPTASRSRRRYVHMDVGILPSSNAGFVSMKGRLRSGRKTTEMFLQCFMRAAVDMFHLTI